MFAVFTFKIEVLIVLKLIPKNHVSVKSKLESALSPLAKKQHHVTSKGLHILRWWWGEG